LPSKPFKSVEVIRGYTNMKGRVYDPVLKRFLTPDPVVADIGDSQSWNPYSYVNNQTGPTLILLVNSKTLGIALLPTTFEGRGN
jgi:hypothetical protein